MLDIKNTTVRSQDATYFLNQIFGRLTVKGNGPRCSDSRRRPQWICLCRCGTFKLIRAEDVRSGNTVSCGCNNVTHGHTIQALWGKRSPEYGSWESMKARCYLPTHASYHNYGALGITVCDRWIGEHGFENFLADMGRKPTPQHSIDRIENTGNYEPKNCKWSDRFEQMRNTKRTRMITYNGKTMCMKDWATHLGISNSTFRYRWEHWPLERIFQSNLEFLKL